MPPVHNARAHILRCGCTQNIQYSVQQTSHFIAEMNESLPVPRHVITSQANHPPVFLSCSPGSLLTIMVNIGFLVGALCSSFAGFADYIAPSILMSAGAVAAGILNIMLLIPGCGFRAGIALRFFTGAAMALVYPMAGKVTASWFAKNRGLAMGCILGAVCIGSAAPHLINALRPPPPPGGLLEWRPLVVACSVVSFVGGVVAAVFLKEGPVATPPIHFVVCFGVNSSRCLVPPDTNGGHLIVATLSRELSECAAVCRC